MGSSGEVEDRNSGWKMTWRRGVCVQLGCLRPDCVRLRVCISMRVCVCVYLDTILRAVEETDAADGGENGVRAVLQHVVGADGRKRLALSSKDSPLHHGEILLVQHLRHLRQLPTDRGREICIIVKKTNKKWIKTTLKEQIKGRTLTLAAIRRVSSQTALSRSELYPW